MRGTLRTPLEAERLRSWATNRMAKEKEKRTQPYASSPSFKKDFTLNEEKKQKRIPKRSKTSKAVGRKPEVECAPILPEGSANAPGVRKSTTPENRNHTLKKTFDPFFFMVFNECFVL